MNKKVVKLLFVFVTFLLIGCSSVKKADLSTEHSEELMASTQLSKAATTLINRLIYDKEMDKFDHFFADAVRYNGSNVDFGLMYLKGLTPSSDFEEYPEEELRKISEYLADAVPQKTSFKVREIKQKDSGCDIIYYVSGLDFMNVYQKVIAMSKQNKLSAQETVKQSIPLFKDIPVVQKPVMVNITLKMDGDKLEISHDRQLESLFAAFFFGQSAYEELNQAIIDENDKWIKNEG